MVIDFKGNLLFIEETVGFPFCRVMFNVFGDVVHFLLATYDVVVVTGLPCE